MSSEERTEAGRTGRLLIIGGSEDRGEREGWKILPHLANIAGGARARILVRCAVEGR